MKQLNLFDKEKKEVTGIVGDHLFIYDGKGGSYSYGIQIDRLVAQGMKTVVICPNSFAIYNKSLTSDEIKLLVKSMNETEGIRWSN